MVLSTFLAGPELNHVMADMVHYSVAASVAEILLSFSFSSFFSPIFQCSRCWLLEERGLGHVGKKLTQVYSLNKFERVGK